MAMRRFVQANAAVKSKQQKLIRGEALLAQARQSLSYTQASVALLESKVAAAIANVEQARQSLADAQTAFQRLEIETANIMDPPEERTI